MKRLYPGLKWVVMFLVIGTMIVGCGKPVPTGCPLDFHLTANDSIPAAGDNVTLYASLLKLSYHWVGPNNFFYDVEGGNSLELPNIRIDQAGWYYCMTSIPGCEPYRDSVYIRVRYAQGTPSCALTNGQIVSTAGVPDLYATTVTKTFNNGYQAMTLHVSGGVGNPVYNFVFNANNGNKEPLDGIYYTVDVPVFDWQMDANVININCNYFPYYFNMVGGQKVYVSHVSGKLRISFCDVEGGDGSGAHGGFTGQVTEQ